MTSLVIRADLVLMELDGPALFINRGQLNSTLLLKVDETAIGDLFISATLCDRMEKALLANEISVRGVFNSSQCIQLVQLNHSNTLINRSAVYDQNYLDTVLPRTGVALSMNAGTVPDALINPDSILTLYLQGKNIGRNRMRLSILKKNINHTSSIIRTAMLGAELANKRASSIDPIVEEPVFGSLMISVVATHMNMEYIHKLSEYKDFSKSSFDDLIQKESGDFISSLSELKRLGRGAPSAAHDFDGLFDLIKNMLPSEGSEIEKITFFAPNSSVKKVSFEIADTLNIRTQLRRDNFSGKTFKGKIDQVTLQSQSIRIQRPFGKQIKCEFSEDDFMAYRDNKLFKAGSFVQVSGQFEARPRIDLLHDAKVELIHNQKF